MFSPQTNKSYVSRPDINVPRGEVGRVIAIAVSDSRFRELLITDTAAALEGGYENKPFNLTPDQRQLLLSVKDAKTLPDFAHQLLENYNRT